MPPRKASRGPDMFDRVAEEWLQGEATLIVPTGPRSMEATSKEHMGLRKETNMKWFVALGAAVALLGALALSSTALAQEPLSVTLDSLEGFAITGSATLTPSEDGSETEVAMNGAGLDPDGTHINHIHDGSGCGEGEYAGVVVTLAVLEADANGDATASTTVTAEMLPFEEIADGAHVLIIHDAAGAPAACGLIPQMVVEEEPTATSPAPAGAPSTGVGAYDSGGGGTGLIWLVVALATFGLAAVAGLAAVRLRTR